MERIVINNDNPLFRDLKMVAEVVNQGGTIIFPTDSVYALGCLLTNKKGIETICKVTNKKEKQAKMSIICPNISVISQYTPQIENHIFREMKRVLPGPFTFILKSNNYIQKYFKNTKEEIGVRIPQSKILAELLPMLDAPLISTSLNQKNTPDSNYVDPDAICEDFEHEVDIILDGGIGDTSLTTILDCTDGDITLIRQGKGVFE
ncbi:MAG: L-threonylcarbamoyladenylate synthase [Saprospiraceae bacterium]